MLLLRKYDVSLSSRLDKASEDDKKAHHDEYKTRTGFTRPSTDYVILTIKKKIYAKNDK